MVNILFPMVTIITKNILNNYFLQKRNVVPRDMPGKEGGGGRRGILPYERGGDARLGV